MSFDVAAEAYDRFMGRYSLLLSPQLADLTGVRRGQLVLDVGCGPGALTAELVTRLVSRFAGRSGLADRLGEDLIGGPDPDERARPGVPAGSESVDKGDKFLDAPEAAPPNGLAGQNAEPVQMPSLLAPGTWSSDGQIRR